MKLKIDDTQANEVWPAIMGDPDLGSAMQCALGILRQVPPAAIAKAVQRIEHECAMGPFLDPTAYLDGRRFKNAAIYKEVLRAALHLREALPEALATMQWGREVSDEAEG